MWLSIPAGYVTLNTLRLPVKLINPLFYSHFFFVLFSEIPYYVDNASHNTESFFFMSLIAEKKISGMPDPPSPL